MVGDVVHHQPVAVEAVGAVVYRFLCAVNDRAVEGCLALDVNLEAPITRKQPRLLGHALVVAVDLAGPSVDGEARCPVADGRRAYADAKARVAAALLEDVAVLQTAQHHVAANAHPDFVARYDRAVEVGVTPAD